MAYATELKAALLGVPADLLERQGAVDGDVAAAMAEGARDRLGASTGVATTGVAGPTRPRASRSAWCSWRWLAPAAWPADSFP